MGYEGLYEVSSLGRVRSLRRVVRCGLGQRVVPEKILSPGRGVLGYPAVLLRDGDGGALSVRIHGLVLEAFVGPRPPGAQCRHLNGDRHDARLCNLAWGSAKENALDRISHGTTTKGRALGPSKFRKMSVESVVALRDGRMTPAECARIHGVTIQAACAARNGKRWRAL